ncbi:hypothetical protein HH212_24320 [Massilia forsythiae]|uniref:Uncharacterized protein n=1 Tax=Massilia forsythiae TaxID=2728020 RepID=A0A7Z2ZW28_9BURK|nr:hypothetical protein [Massilia forsythiae]QJE02742.1 hypothetical protein HH212_24320 [Massilia forsythiae]
MKNRTITSIFLIVATSIAQAASPALGVGEPFIKAQEKLQAEGWRADLSAHAASGEYTGVERQLVQDGFAEVDYCSLGESLCVFQYIRNNACLRLHAKGEETRSMKIESWSNQCREKGASEDVNPLPADVRYAMQWRGDCDNFGQCEGMNEYLRNLEKKYAGQPAILKLLGAYDDSLQPGRRKAQ